MLGFVAIGLENVLLRGTNMMRNPTDAITTQGDNPTHEKVRKKSGLREEANIVRRESHNSKAAAQPTKFYFEKIVTSTVRFWPFLAIFFLGWVGLGL